ncbi:MAG: M20/M25/M40 family metallo-hydrolase [Chloroflexota bacterium]
MTTELQTLIDKLAAEDPTFKAKITTTLVRLPFEIDEERDIVVLAKKIVEKHTKKDAVIGAQSGWTDAQILHDAGIDSILLGPCGDGAHAKEEWVDLDTVADFAAMLVDFMLEFCGRN